MFGKPAIGNNQQRWDGVALGFVPVQPRRRCPFNRRRRRKFRHLRRRRRNDGAWHLAAQVWPLCLVTGVGGSHDPKRTELNRTVEAATAHFKLNASASSHRTEARADDRAGDLRARPNTTMNRPATTA
jgi:hypothetical protein